MLENKAKMDNRLRKKFSPKNFTKNPIKGTKYTVAISSNHNLVTVTQWIIFIKINGVKTGPKTGSWPVLPSFAFSRFSLIFWVSKNRPPR